MHGMAPVIQPQGIRVLTFMAAMSGTLCTAATAQPWNQPIPEPATKSTAQTIKLAEQLNKVGARFFGAHWCPACKEQMKLFGKQAGGNLSYGECGLPDKYPYQLKQCRDENIRSIPTWTRPGSTRLQGVDITQEALVVALGLGNLFLSQSGTGHSQG